MSIVQIIAILLVLAGIIVAAIDKQWRNATFLVVLGATILYVFSGVRL